MKEFWSSLSRGKQIALSVFASHFFVLFLLTIHHFASGRSPKKPMIVHTVQQVSPVQTFPQLKVPPRPKQKITNASSSSPKKQLVETGKPKTETPKQKNASSALNELTKSLETLSSLPNIPRSSSLSIPKSIQKRSHAQVEQSTDPSYAESLVLILQNTLDLPEFGAVKASLELSPDGSLQSFEILETKSQKNADFLKKRLPELTFPCFNGTERKQLTLVFRNVEDR